MKSFKTFIFCCWTICLTFMSHGQTISNGDFELSTPNVTSGNFHMFLTGSTDITSWTVMNQHVDINHVLHNNEGGEGNQHIDLNSTGEITQTINGLTPGQEFVISFITSENGLSSLTGTCSAILQIDGSTKLGWVRQFNNAPGIWETKFVKFMATSSSATITFRAVRSDHVNEGVLVDDVKIQEAPPSSCFGEIEVEQIPCDLFSFNLETPFMTNVTSILEIDGQEVLTPAFPMALEKGEHTICYYYLGFDLLDETICCNQVCTTINVEGTENIIRDTMYCDFPGLPSLGVFFDPCAEHPGFSSFDINGGTNTLCPGSGVFLPEGNHTINYYDADGCLRLVVDLTVIRNVATVQSCKRYITIPCEGPDYSVEALTPLDGTGDCDCSFETTDIVTDELISIDYEFPNDPQKGKTTVIKKFYNETKCIECTVEFEIIYERCDFEPLIDFYYNQSDPQTITFKRVEPITACGNETWTLYDNNGNVVMTQSYVAQNPAVSHTWTNIPYGENYKLELTTCVCVCNESCCKTVEYVFHVQEPGMFVYLDPYTDNWKIPQNLNETVTSISNLEGSFKLFPNPTSSVFTITYASEEPILLDRVMILDLNGKVLRDLLDFRTGDKIDISGYSAGEYIVYIIYNNTPASLKVIISE